MSDKQVLIKVKNLSVEFSGKLVLENINFTVKKHDILVVIGPNGAGKSTLLKALLNLISYKGTVHIGAQKIGYLPSQESLYRDNLPPLTVQDFFSFKELSLASIRKSLYEVGLSGSILDQQIISLSTGQFQRMMIAWVLIDEPSVLLLDEPTAGIDVEGQETIYALLYEIWQKRNLTIILTTHHIHIIWKYATHVLCINKKMICYGAPDEAITSEILQRIYGKEVGFYEHKHPIRD